MMRSAPHSRFSAATRLIRAPVSGAPCGLFVAVADWTRQMNNVFTFRTLPRVDLILTHNAESASGVGRMRGNGWGEVCAGGGSKRLSAQVLEHYTQKFADTPDLLRPRAENRPNGDTGS